MIRPNTPIGSFFTLCFALAFFVGSATVLPGSADAQTSRRQQKLEEALKEKKQKRELFQIEMGEKANQKRQEAIDQLKKILSEESYDSDIKAQMLMRLAEFYHEQSKYEFNLEMEDFDKRYEEWFDLPEAVQKKTKEPEIISVKSKQYTKKSIENYRIILQSYPTYRRADEALFFLGFMLTDIGQKKDGLDMYKKLVKTYPESTFVPDGWHAIGEYYFNTNNVYKALQAYKKAAEFTTSRIYTHALYKMGWCYFNVGEFDTAIDTMKDLLLEANRLEQSGERNTVSVREEALNDLVLFFSEKDDLQAAKDFFLRYGEKKYYRKMLTKLGGKYIEQGKNELAIQTYRELIADNPFASDNPSHQHEIIMAYQKRDRFSEASTEITKLVEIYGRDGRWARENQDNKEASRESERLIELNLYDVAVENFNQATKRRSANLLRLAESNYAAYLDYFPTGQRSYDARYWYAEALYKLRKFDLATGEYEQVVAANSKGRHLKDAAANTIFSIDAHLKPRKKELDKAAERKVRALKRSGAGTAKYAEVELDPWESRLIKACDTFASVLPNDDRTLKFLYKAALLLNDRNHFNESNERFLQIVRASPKSKMAEEGVHTILSTYEKIENWEGLNAAGREFYNNPDLSKKKKFKLELKNIYQRATFKIAEGFASSDKFAEAAGAFDGFYREFGDSDVRDLALYNAAFYFNKVGNRSRVLELRHEFIDTFPKPVGKEAKDMMLFEKSVAELAVHYESIADYPKATELYRLLFDRDESFEDGARTAKDAIFNAASYNEALGNLDDAVQDFRDYMNRDDVEDDEKMVIRMRIAHMYRNADKTSEAMAAFKSVFSDKEVASRYFDASMEARVHYGRMLGAEDGRKKQLAFYRDSMKAFNSRKSGLADDASAHVWAAEMAFGLLEPEFDEYSEIKMPKSSKKTTKVFRKKLEAQGRLESNYKRILDMKSEEWIIAATYRIGTTYGNFADVLKNAPCPKKLDEDQCQIYKFGLQDKIYPLIEKAVEAFGSVREKSYQAGLYTEFTNKALDELSRLQPEEFPANAEEYPLPDYTSNPYTVVGFVR